MARSIAFDRFRSAPGWVWIVVVLAVVAVFAGLLLWYGNQPESKAIRGQIVAGSAYATFNNGADYATEFSYFPSQAKAIFIGDQSFWVDPDMYIEFSGQIFLSSTPEPDEPFASGIAGRATSVRFNSEQQLPARWSVTDDLPTIILTAAITGFVSVVVGGTLGWRFGPRQLPQPPPSQPEV